VAAQVLTEAQQVYGAAEEEPTRRAADAMPYTAAVLKEALRKYSVVPVVTRDLREDDTLSGYQVPAGTLVAVNIQVGGWVWQETVCQRLGWVGAVQQALMYAWVVASTQSGGTAACMLYLYASCSVLYCFSPPAPCALANCCTGGAQPVA
jgi:hypothetical protein